MKKIAHFFKNHKLLTGTLVILALIVVFALTRSPKEVKREYLTVSRTTVAQEVDVTGRVVPAHEVDLAIQTGGKVAAVNVHVGDRVNAGDVLVRVDTSDLQVLLARQQAELQKSENELANQKPKTNAEDDLRTAYEEGFNAVAEAFVDFSTTIKSVDDILKHSYIANNTLYKYPDAAREHRKKAELDFYRAEDLYKSAFVEYKTLSRESEGADIESLVIQTHEVAKVVADSVKSLYNLVDYVEGRIDEDYIPAQLTEDKGDLTDFTADINVHLLALVEIRNAINDSKQGQTDEGYDIEQIRIDIKQAELDIQDTYVQINNRSITAPISGVVTDVQANVGETISSGNPVVSLISADQFEIEAHLPESDIAKVRVGAEAQVTLDAYGSDDMFQAKVASVDPAETIVEGVATYKTVLHFTEDDERIKSGMTADITIQGERKENVIAVPQRSVITKDGEKYVQVLEGETVVEKQVKTGLRGTDGNIEVTDGLVEGDNVIVFVETN